MSSDTLHTTPLHGTHVALGAKMVPFAGFDMPVQYTGILDEHKAVREAAGLFDVSHMGEFRLRGPDAIALAHQLVTNDATKLADGKAMYAVLCRADGTAVDDLLVYRIAEDDVMLVVNASNMEKDWEHIQAVRDRQLNVELTNESDDMALLALQGPKAFEVFEAATGMSVDDLKYYHFTVPDELLGAKRAIVSRTGYTGEPGLEIYCENEAAVRIWESLMAAGEAFGLRPAGLGARDTLRLEAGYCLYGHELDDSTTPLDAGLGWVVKLDVGDFVGRDALAAQKEAGPDKKLIGLVVEGRRVPRQGYAITDAEGTPIGTVTSGTQSPTTGVGIALGYVPRDEAYTAPGTTLGIDVRGRQLEATVTRPPFHTAD
ncbi:MAG: glycine cleavage system aminomethyltransferase GcvT [Bacteroidota bacterium]